MNKIMIALVFLLAGGSPAVASAAAEPWSRIAAFYLVHTNELSRYTSPISFQVSLCDLHRNNCARLAQSESYVLRPGDKAISARLQLKIERKDIEKALKQVSLKPSEAYLELKTTGDLPGDSLAPLVDVTEKHGWGNNVMTTSLESDRKTGAVFAMETIYRLER